ncbi:MAG TPA: VWA domain-containing protein [Terriglobales bacterium]|nr:VWA domain-containing protein [Terriglobales bacterium]
MTTRRLFVAGVLLLAAALPLLAQQSTEQPNAPAVWTPKQEQEREKGQEPPTTFKVDVKLVNVFVTVVDQQGAPVAGLVKDNFRLSEDGVPQDIRLFAKESELPLSIVVAIDSSLSTRTNIKLELESARRFIHEILRPQDSLSLYQFAEAVTELVRFTNDMRAIDRGIDRVQIGSATALYDAVYLGSQALETRHGRKVLVVITDGGDTMSQVDYAEALRAAQGSEAIVYSIIIVPIESSAGRNTGGEHALIQMSNDTGGKYYYAGSTAELDRAFRQISEQLRTQYLLGYYPKARVSDSDFRRLEVTLVPAVGEAPAEVRDLHARHRTGYYTSAWH